MTVPEILLNAVGSLIFIVWIFSMRSWIKRGLLFPRYIHAVAAALTMLGAGCIGLAIAKDLVDWRLGVGCLAIPAAATYLGWLWMFGPEFGDADTDAD